MTLKTMLRQQGFYYTITVSQQRNQNSRPKKVDTGKDEKDTFNESDHDHAQVRLIKVKVQWFVN